MSAIATKNLIAVVDDDELVRGALQRLLKASGLGAVSFGSAEDLLKSGQLPDIACLIVDIRMPGMSGLELLAKLKAERCRIPIIFITAHGDAKMRSQAMRDGAVKFLFSGPAGAWSFGASLAQPIFTGGRLRSGVRLAEAQQQTATLFYQQSIQEAFRSVSDALVAYRKTREFRAQQEVLFESAKDAARLSQMRYTGGATGYLEVLTKETNAFSAELGLVQARLNELLALVQLYEALGGGWQQ